MCMQWANECVDPQIRMYHVIGASLCQEMDMKSEREEKWLLSTSNI